jgi:REP element-mobilizing transposase RayT
MRDDGRAGGAYYHLINRTAGTRRDRPFGDVEKAEFVKLLLRLSTFYTIEIIGYCVMSNHYHLIVWAPDKEPEQAEILRRFRKFYPDRDPPEAGSPQMATLARRMRDFSDLAKHLQMRYASWYNRTRPVRRRGALWADRFKSLLLQGSRNHPAVWNCLAYVEMNPVRAKIADDPADYRFSSWGRYCGSGKHPFQGNLTRHLRRTVERERARLPAQALIAEFRARLAADTALAIGGDLEDAAAAADDARVEPDFWLRADRRVRYWTDGAVIGSKSFVREIYAQHFGEDRAKRHRFGRGRGDDGTILFSMRRPLADL